MPDLSDDLPARVDVTSEPVRVEVLGPGDAWPPRDEGVVLRGEAAVEVLEALGAPVARAGWRLGRKATQKQYRLVPPSHLSKGLGDGSLRWATSKAGDASPLIKNAKTGKIAGHGALKGTRPSPTKLVGPAVWEAMAMATQQHYLVEINAKLQGVESKLDEVLARMDDELLGTLGRVQEDVAASREQLADGRAPSPTRMAHLRDGVKDAATVWHKLDARVARLLKRYADGETTADELQVAWSLFLYAARVLGDASAVLTVLPYDDVGALEATAAEEQDRAARVFLHVRERARELRVAHSHWAARQAEYGLGLPESPTELVAQTVRRRRPAKPQQKPLDPSVVWHAGQIAAPPRPPKALVVTVNDDSSVNVAAEQVTSDDEH